MARPSPVDAFDFIDTTLRRADGLLTHSWREGRLGPDAMLDDVAAMSLAALRLFEATGKARFLDAGVRFAEDALTRFADGQGGVVTTAASMRDPPLVRPRHADDGATPSGVGLLAEALAKLWHMTDAPLWRERAQSLIAAFSGGDNLTRSPLLFAAADQLERGGCVQIEGALNDPLTLALSQAALRAPDPSLSVVRLDRANAPEALKRRPSAPFAPSAMLCRNSVCSLPVDSVRALATLLTH